jgi:hypothetical protein
VPSIELKARNNAIGRFMSFTPVDSKAQWKSDSPVPVILLRRLLLRLKPGQRLLRRLADLAP